MTNDEFIKEKIKGFYLESKNKEKLERILLEILKRDEFNFGKILKKLDHIEKRVKNLEENINKYLKNDLSCIDGFYNENGLKSCNLYVEPYSGKVEGIKSFKFHYQL
jgi:hypothetical protein